MKIIILILTFLSSSVYGAPLTTMTVNQDVYKCGNEVKHPVSLEAHYLFYKFNELDLLEEHASFEEGLEILIDQLSQISPSRAALLAFLHKTPGQIAYLKNVVIQRSSQISVLITPPGCSIEIISELTIEEGHHGKRRIIISLDLYEKLSVKDKLIFWLNFTLDFIQTEHIVSFQDRAFNQISGKEFTACWFSSACRPKSTLEMHKLVQDEDFGLLYFEQDHNLIPLQHRLSFYPNGYIKSFERYYNPGKPYKDPIRDIFKSYAKFRNRKIEIFTEAYWLRDKEIFNSDGSLRCANFYTDPSKGPPFLNLHVFHEDDKWMKSSYFQFSFPLCWTPEGKVIQGFYKEDESRPVKISFNNHSLEIDDEDGRESKMSAFLFYENGSIKWMSNAKGTVSIDSRNFKIKDFVVFYPDGKVRCAQMNEKVSFHSSRGESYTCDPASNQYCPMACFDEDEKFSGPHGEMYDLYYLTKDLTI